MKDEKSIIELAQAMIKQGQNKKALKLLANHADKENSEITLYLADLLWTGTLSSANKKAATKYYDILAKNGHVESAHFLSALYFRGEVVRKNMEKCDEYLKLISRSKDPDHKELIKSAQEQVEKLRQIKLKFATK